LKEKLCAKKQKYIGELNEGKVQKHTSLF